MRAAIYARYSTDKQSDTSIEDQTAAARTYAEAQGWTVVATHADMELSGSIPVAMRPGGRALLADLVARKFDILVLEGLERLSREISESESIIKRLEHRGIRIVGLLDNYDSKTKGRKVMRIARGMINELYLDDVREKTHRGLVGNMSRGMSAGGRTYGYTTEQTAIGRLMVIEPSEAARVVSIFEQVAEGRSPRWIVAQLNAQGVPSARGGTWAASALVGSAVKGLGMINNRLYIGEVTWNKSQWLKDPETGKRRRMERPASEWITRQDESLRIVSLDLWERVQSRVTGHTRGISGGKGASPKTLFGGLITCGTCKGPIIAVNRERYGCGQRKDRGPAVCSNSRTALRHVLDARLITAVREEMLSPWSLQLLQAEVRAILVAHNRGAGEAGETQRKRLAELRGQIDKLVAAVATVGISPALASALQAAEREKADLEAAASAQAPKDVDLVIRDVEARYKRMMLRLQAILEDEDRASTRQMLADMLGPMTLENEKDGTMAVLLEEPVERLMLSAVNESLGLVAGARNLSQRRIRLT